MKTFLRLCFALFLFLFALFLFLDVGVYFGTSKPIWEAWPIQKFIPGGAIYYKIFPPNKQIQSDSEGQPRIEGVQYTLDYIDAETVTLTRCR